MSSSSSSFTLRRTVFCERFGKFSSLLLPRNPHVLRLIISKKNLFIHLHSLKLPLEIKYGGNQRQELLQNREQGVEKKNTYSQRRAFCAFICGTNPSSFSFPLTFPAQIIKLSDLFGDFVLPPTQRTATIINMASLLLLLLLLCVLVNIEMRSAHSFSDDVTLSQEEPTKRKKVLEG